MGCFLRCRQRMCVCYLRQVNEVNGGDNVFVRCVSVCLCLCVRSGPVNQTSLKWLKLRTSNLPCMFPGTVRTWRLKKFSKGSVAKVTWPAKFLVLNANSSKTVKGTDFQFDVLVPLLWYSKYTIVEMLFIVSPKCKTAYNAILPNIACGIRYVHCTCLIIVKADAVLSHRKCFTCGSPVRVSGAVK